MSAPVFAPAGLALATSAKIIDGGTGQIPSGGHLIVDMENMRECDSAAICLLIELMRRGKEKNCRIEVRNVGEQLKKFMQLYRLNALLAPAEQGAAADASPQATAETTAA